MLCWSCGKEIADDAVRCEYCEADVVDAPGLQEMNLAREFIESMDPDMQSELLRVFQSSKNGEEFVNRIMVGDCPKCGSSKTGDCEHDPDVEDITIGRCFECGYLWCTICDSPYSGDICPHCADLEDEFEDELEGELEDALGEGDPELDRYHLLAAEIFGYSFANYRDHLGIGNTRYEQLMPDAARLLEHAVQEDWPASRVAKELFPDDPLDETEAEGFIQACKNALQVLNAEDPSEAFRHAVRQSIEHAIAGGLEGDDAVEKLVTQICFRAADLAVLLELDGQPLARYSRHLRREPNVNYYDGYFDE